MSLVEHILSTDGLGVLFETNGQAGFYTDDETDRTAVRLVAEPARRAEQTDDEGREQQDTRRFHIRRDPNAAGGGVATVRLFGVIELSGEEYTVQSFVEQAADYVVVECVRVVRHERTGEGFTKS